MREHLEAFLATVREERGKSLPRNVEEEFRRYVSSPTSSATRGRSRRAVSSVGAPRPDDVEPVAPRLYIHARHVVSRRLEGYGEPLRSLRRPWAQHPMGTLSVLFGWACFELGVLQLRRADRGVMCYVALTASLV
jgi:hypothetical protein